MSKFGTSVKLIQTSLPPTPPWAASVSAPSWVVDTPFRPTPNVQWPAVTTIVASSSVPVQVNQPPGSSKRRVDGVRDVEQELADVGMLAGVGRAVRDRADGRGEGEDAIRAAENGKASACGGSPPGGEMGSGGTGRILSADTASGPCMVRATVSRRTATGPRRAERRRRAVGASATLCMKSMQGGWRGSWPSATTR